MCKQEATGVASGLLGSGRSCLWKATKWCFSYSHQRCQGGRGSCCLPFAPDPQRPFADEPLWPFADLPPFATAPDDELLAPQDPPTTSEPRAPPFPTTPTTGAPFPLYPFEGSPFRRAAALPSSVRHHQPFSGLNFSE